MLHRHILRHHSKSHPFLHFRGKSQYILLREGLTKQFNVVQWEQLKVQNLSCYIRLQEQIYDQLMLKQDLFYKYFKLFYKNHITIYHWCLLARQNHHEIELYIFKELLAKKLDHYDHLFNFKQNQKEFERLSKGKSKELKRISQIEHRSSIHELSNDIFNFMASKSITASLKSAEKPWKSKLKGKRDNRSSLPSLENSLIQQNQQMIRGSNASQKIRRSVHVSPRQELKQKVIPLSSSNDFYNIYIKTLDTCQGNKYNYEKHMEGFHEKKQNIFIQNPKTKTVDNSRSEQIVFKEINSIAKKNIKSSFEFSAMIDNSDYDKKRGRQSQIIFKKLGSQHIGKFIRK